jgi:signal transduction histidine kinase
MIQRMIANLLDNAIKYTPPEGKIEVSIHNDEGESVSVSIKDSGIGISEKDLPHIFERFYRCDPSRTETGIGMGLSLARAIAQAHGSDIDVISSLGEGSTFMVTLPESSSSPR